MGGQSRLRTTLSGCAILSLFVLGCFALAFFLWFQPRQSVPLAEPLDLPAPTQTYAQELGSGPVASIQLNMAQKKPTPAATPRPLCGKTAQWTVLVVATDQGGTDNYLYGLADVIRVVQVDFTQPQINVVALPRNLLVTPPARLKVDGPLLLNQAYFFGTPGMEHYEGSGHGAGSLAETIQYNFGVTADHYLVVNFQAFVNFVNAIGGIEVDLPTYVDDRPNAYFPPGKQTLNGQQALTLGRIRRKYSDLTRIDNQTLVLQAVFKRLQNPAVIKKIPQIYAAMKDSVITDVTPNQITDLTCMATKVKSDDLDFYSPAEPMIQYDQEFIPTMNQDMLIYHWDQEFIDWVSASLSASGESQ